MTSDLVTVSVCGVRVSVSLEKPPRFPNVGVGLWVCECYARARLVRPRACVSVVDGCTVGLAGAIPRESTAQLKNTSAAAGLGISLLTARCDQPLPVPGALQDGLDACSKALGEATSHASGPAGHIGQRARVGVWDFWLFFKVLPATLSLRCTTLCSMSARGGGMI